MAAALTERPNQSGFPLAKKTGIRVGRIYVVLARMEIAGRVESFWAKGPLRDRTRLYRLAPDECMETLAGISALVGQHDGCPCRKNGQHRVHRCEHGTEWWQPASDDDGKGSVRG